METNNDLNEERRRSGIPAIARTVLPRNLWENPVNWKRTKFVMAAILMLATAGSATAFTVGKKTTPPEAVQQVASVPAAAQLATSKPSDDANLPPYFRVVDSGQKCGDQKVEVEDPDTVPNHPKLTVLLATNPCFNFAWFENGGKSAVINYIPGNGDVSLENSRDLEEAAKYTRIVMNMNEISGMLDAFTLDMVRKVSGPEMVNEIKKLTKKFEQEIERSKPRNRELDQAIKDAIYWNMVQKVAYSEGLTVRLSDATLEREAAYKLPGDFLVPSGTADRFKMILIRMSPSPWDRFDMERNFASRAYKQEVGGNYEKAIHLAKKAISHLEDPREIEAARKDTKTIFPKIADQILASS